MSEVKAGRVIVSALMCLSIMLGVALFAYALNSPIAGAITAAVFVALYLFYRGKTQTSTTAASSSGRQSIGFTMLVIGVLAAAYYYLIFDISIASHNGGRTINLGLVADRQMGIIIGIAIAFAGGILTRSSKATPAPAPVVARDERDCPHCAERILVKANICKHCGKDVQLIAAAA